jgi:hypothetical protein
MASIGDPVAVTTLESEYWRYARFCLQRSIRPAAFQTWINAQRSGWKCQRSKEIRDSVAARTQADVRTIHEVIT